MKRRNGHGNDPTPAGARESADRVPTDEPAAEAVIKPTLREAAADLSGESSDTLTLYLRDVRRTTLFTAEEEYATAVRARGNRAHFRTRSDDIMLRASVVGVQWIGVVRQPWAPAKMPPVHAIANRRDSRLVR